LESGLRDIRRLLEEDRLELSGDEIVFRRDGTVDGTMAYILTFPREGLPGDISHLLQQFDAIVENTRRRRAARIRKFIANWKAERVALAETVKKPRRGLIKMPSPKPIDIPRECR
jgi:hypothetical protein